jgi:hypothetical protein
MGTDWAEKVRIRAYEIWERTGHSGSPEDHWFQAEIELELERPAIPEQDSEGKAAGTPELSQRPE